MRKIAVPEEGMETLFGSYDENLRFLESLLNVTIRTQGHDLLVDGDPLATAKVERVVNGLASLAREGYRIANGDVKTAAQLVAEDDGVELRDYFLKSAATPRTSGKRQVAPKTRQPASLPRARSTSTTSCSASGRPGPARPTSPWRRPSRFLLAKKVSADHPRAPGGRGRREARLPARRPAGEGEPLPAAALRRPLRHARGRAGRAAARARHHRDRAARVHARAHAQRLLRHPGRGAEHHLRADEDVPDPPRVRLQGGHHRRHHADRPARRDTPPASSRR